LGRIAVIDIGTNSVLYLLAEADGPGNTVSIHQEIRTTREGRGIASSGRIAVPDLETTMATLREFRDLSRRQGADRLICAGTHVFRKAENREEALGSIRGGTGIVVEVLSEREEAELSFSGAVHGRGDVAGALVADIGGGSTEFTCGRDGRPGWSVSIPIGALVLSETFLGVHPPEGEGYAAMEQHIRSVISGCELRMPPDEFAFFCVGGTVTTLAAMELGLERYDPEAVDGMELDREVPGRWLSRLRPLSAGQKRALISVDPERGDIIEAGLMVLSAAMEKFQLRRVRISDRGLRFGIALREFSTGRSSELWRNT
jgi:exopolyphosphatase/guanosine-5'-triphosphate,3'-diphosphate pyrophosphatase